MLVKKIQKELSDIAFIIAIIPSLCWGSLGILSTIFGGNASQQTVGLTYGGLLFGLLTYFGWVVPHHYFMDSKLIWIGLISGILWALGQAFQFLAIKTMHGVSIALPLSMTSQLIGNALLGAALLGEWTSIQQWVVGIIAIGLIVSGVLMIQKRDNKNKATPSGVNCHGLFQVLVSTLAYMGYFITPRLMQRWLHISNNIVTAGHGINYMVAIVLPQSIGMVIGAYLYVFLISHETKYLHARPTWQNVIVGVVWALGNVTMFISIANPRLGQATATTLGQLGFIVGAFGGIFILHEHKTRWQLKMIVGGSIIALIGAVIISNISWLAALI